MSNGLKHLGAATTGRNYRLISVCSPSSLVHVGEAAMMNTQQNTTKKARAPETRKANLTQYDIPVTEQPHTNPRRDDSVRLWKLASRLGEIIEEAEMIFSRCNLNIQEEDDTCLDRASYALESFRSIATQNCRSVIQESAQ